MVRIAILQLGYETNTFMEGTAELTDLGSGGWTSGTRVAELFRGGRSGISGALAAAQDRGAAVVPMDLITRGGAFNAGPKMSRKCVQEAMDHICGELEARAAEYDGLYFAMHGAGCADGFDDADGYFLRRIREVLGGKPIMASLDLHANITPEMVRLADGLFGIKTVPHVDFYEAGYLATSMLIDTLERKRNVKIAFRRLPLLIPSSAGCTMDGAAGKIREYFAEYGKEHHLIDATFFHGFSATDSPEASASVVVVADGRVPDREADVLARYVWDLRKAFAMKQYSASEAVERALSMKKKGYVVIYEGTDNPGSGCPGDGTHLLRELLRRDLPGCIMGPLFDPEAASECHRHIVGDRFSIRVGGKTLPVFGEPLHLENAELLALSDGTFRCASPVHRGAIMHYGPSARIRSGNVEMILVSERFQTYDDRPFLMTGAKMETYSLVALKSMNHFRAYFQPIADGIVMADTPSIYPADLRKMGHRHVLRPIYPLEPDTEYAGNWP